MDDNASFIDTFAEKYGTKYDKAVACLIKDRNTLLARGHRLPRDDPDLGREVRSAVRREEPT